MSLFSSISGFISNAIVGGDSPVHLPSAPAPLADVMSTASAMTTAFFSDNKPQQQQPAAAAAAAAVKPPPSPTPPPSSSRGDRSSTPSLTQSRTSSTSSLSESSPAAAGSRSAVPGRPSAPPPPPQAGKVAAVDDGPDLGPEFSHLSAEERRQIQMVMARAAHMTDDRQPKAYVLPRSVYYR